MAILLLIVILAVLGIVTEEKHKKARRILKSEGYKLGFYVRYFDVKKFLEESTDSIKKEELRKLLKTWIYLVISSLVTILLVIIIAMFFPRLAMV